MVDLELSGKHGKQTQSDVHLLWRYFKSSCAVFNILLEYRPVDTDGSIVVQTLERFRLLSSTYCATSLLMSTQEAEEH